MSELEQHLPVETGASRMRELQVKLHRLERRDWWLWWCAVGVMLLLTLAVVSLSFPTLFREEFSFFQFNLTLAVRGLVGLVLLFNTYTVFQHIQIKRLRQQLSEQLETMVRLEIRAEEFHKLAVLDPLTGLYNRRFADERLAAEVARSHRHGHRLTVLMIDLDDFKRINDRYGHAAGDLVLKEFAQRLRKEVRVSDLAVRLGGDEFMVLLPECPPEQVPHLLERLGPLEVDFRGAKIPIRFSAGWVGYASGESAERLLERADQVLYAEKRSGKANLHISPVA